MSKIPYQFVPIPTYFQEIGWLDFKKDGDHFKRSYFIHWCFSRCSAERRVVFHDHKQFILEPFEFIFGRRVCSDETGLTEREIRTYIDQLNSYSFGLTLEKTANSVTNRFTCYKWVWNGKEKSNDQLKDQPATNRRPTGDHNQEGIESDKKRDIKESDNGKLGENPEVEPNLSLSYSAPSFIAPIASDKTSVFDFDFYTYKFPDGSPISERMRNASKKYDAEYRVKVIDNILVVEDRMRRGKKYDNPEAYAQDLAKKDAAETNRKKTNYLKVNNEFLHSLKNSHKNLSDFIKTLETVVHLLDGTDNPEIISKDLHPETFEHVVTRHCQKEKICNT